MSDRTCKKCGRQYEFPNTDKWYSADHCTFSCEQSERVAGLETELIAKGERIAELERQLAEARKDSERLDWLMNDTVNCPTSMWLTISRQAIDHTMKGRDDE